MNLFKIFKVKDVDESTRKLLEEISQQCETCNVFASTPQRFKVPLPPEKIFFNEEVALDLTWLEGKAIFHVVDCETHFTSAYR